MCNKKGVTKKKGAGTWPSTRRSSSSITPRHTSVSDPSSSAAYKGGPGRAARMSGGGYGVVGGQSRVDGWVSGWVGGWVGGSAVGPRFASTTGTCRTASSAHCRCCLSPRPSNRHCTSLPRLPQLTHGGRPVRLCLCNPWDGNGRAALHKGRAGPARGASAARAWMSWAASSRLPSPNSACPRRKSALVRTELSVPVAGPGGRTGGQAQGLWAAGLGATCMRGGIHL